MPELSAQQDKKKVLLLHCQYLQRGGEDQVVAAEGRLIASAYQLLCFVRSNEELLAMGRLAQLRKTIWNTQICAELQRVLYRHQPDIVHVHNTFPLLSPAVFRLLARWKRQRLRRGQGVKVVLTLHNFRLHCPQASLLRPPRHSDNKQRRAGSQLCQRCIERGNFWPAIAAKCYRNSRAMTLAVAVMLGLHKRLRSWQCCVDQYIYLNSAQKILLVKAGFPEGRFVFKPNSVVDPYRQRAGQNDPLACDLTNRATWGQTKGQPLRLLFAGRLSEEKGLRLLLECVQELRQRTDLERSIELRLAGDGPLRKELLLSVRRFAAEDSKRRSELRLTYLGQLEREALLGELQRAHFLLLPSIWYEGMPIILLEALSLGRPALSFCLGASAQVIRNQENGILLPFFKTPAAERSLRLEQTYNHTELASQLASAIVQAGAMSWQRYHTMCGAARRDYETHYTPEKNLQALRAIYEGGPSEP